MALLAGELLLILVTTTGKVRSGRSFSARSLGQRVGVWFLCPGPCKTERGGEKKGERGDNKNGNTARCLKLK